MLQSLPNAVLYNIAQHLATQTPFRDKVDIAIDAASISCVCKCHRLAQEIIYIIDPMSLDGKLTTNVLDNLIRKKNKHIPARVAKHSWGLTDTDLAEMPHKNLSNKQIIIYKLQDVKKFSEVKFQGQLYNTHAQRIQTLSNILQTIRPDSKYCDSYIKTGKGNPENIVRLLKEMDFYHTYTNYPQLYWVYTQTYSMEYGYYDRDHISSNAKCVALKRFIKQHPDKLHLIPQSLLRFL